MRAEEVIVEVLRQKRALMESGSTPKEVALSPGLYTLVEKYRLALGVVEGPVPDYLQKGSLFGLDICIDDSSRISVR